MMSKGIGCILCAAIGDGWLKVLNGAIGAHKLMCIHNLKYKLKELNNELVQSWVKHLFAFDDVNKCLVSILAITCLQSPVHTKTESQGQKTIQASY